MSRPTESSPSSYHLPRNVKLLVWASCLNDVASEMIYAVFHALTEPAEKTLVASLAGSGGKGLAFGWYNCTIGIAALPASLIFGVLYEEIGPFAAFGWGAGLAFLAVVLLAGVRQQ